MKKLLIVLAFVCVSLSSMAQEETPTLKYSVATNSFWSNWFVQAGGEWTAWYSSEEHGKGYDRSPFASFRSKPNVAFAIGKWFTPGLGFRTKLQGFWGRTVQYGDKEKGKYNECWILNEHVMLNVSNLIWGYNQKRVVNVIPFFGAGFGRTMTHDLYAMDLSAGLLSTFRLNDRLALHLELGLNRLESDIDGGDETTNALRGWDSHDNQVYGEIGLTLNIGKTGWSKVPDVEAIKALSQSQIDALNAQLNDANAENERLKNMIANQKPAEDKTIKEFVTTPISVFFNLDKTNIASKKDLVNVAAIAKYAKENGAKLLVNGYADSATSNAKHNQWLSEKRAETLANELVTMGVSRDVITTVGKGGVDELSPISFNRRATVQVTE